MTGIVGLAYSNTKCRPYFYEVVRFDQNELIVREEIGFVGISHAGDERWNFCIGVIASYEIDQAKIFGETEEGINFEFTVSFGESLPHSPPAGSF